MHELFTIGHSTHPIETFIKRLTMHNITAVTDVRSNPYSRYNPQFNREPLQRELKKHHIAYVFLGRELGPRSEDPNCYVNGRVRYSYISKTALFREGIERLRQGMDSYRIAIMCAEKDPIMCHRTILVCRNLRAKEIKIEHILEDGSIEEDAASIRRLMKHLGLEEMNLFETPEEIVEKAYDIQGEKIAYVEKSEANKVQDRY